MTDIEELIKELEEADYGSLSLDMKVFDAIRNHDMEVVRATPKSFTTSVDAALSLLPEGRSWSIEAIGSFVEAYVWQKETWRKPSGNPPFEGRARSPAIALTIAALKARKEKE